MSGEQRDSSGTIRKYYTCFDGTANEGPQGEAPCQGEEAPQKDDEEDLPCGFYAHNHHIDGFQSRLHPYDPRTPDEIKDDNENLDTRRDRPTAQEVADRTYLRQAQCPYGFAYGADSNNNFMDRVDRTMDDMMQNICDLFRDGYKRDGCPEGPQVNDHHWLIVGKGNTLGMVGGSLEIGMDATHKANIASIPDKLRVGLFSESNVYPAVIRFSDFGLEPALALRFIRLGVKIPHKDGFNGVMDFTCTESNDTFTQPDIRWCCKLFGDNPTPSRYMYFKDKIQEMQTKGRLAIDYIHQFTSGYMPGKTYYSQLPYMLGEHGCFKWKFVGLQKYSRWKYECTVKDSRQSLKDFIENSDLKFEMYIQYRTDPHSFLVKSKQTTAWPEEWISVGTLTLKKQLLDEDYMGVLLKEAMVEHLGDKLDKEKDLPWLHKMTPFHPLQTLNDHVPLGDVQQFRARAYPTMMEVRQRMFRGNAAKSVHVPFDKLVFDPKVAHLFLPTDTKPFYRFHNPPLLHQVDKYTRTLLDLMPPKIHKINKTAGFTDRDVDAAKMKATFSKKTISVQLENHKIVMIKQDQFLGKLPLVKAQLLKYLRNQTFFPLVDVINNCSPQEEKVALMHSGVLQVFPHKNHNWIEYRSDAALSRFFFYGVGTVYLRDTDTDEAEHGMFVCDLSHLAKLEVREQFAQYGYKLFFDEKMKPTKILDCSIESDEDKYTIAAEGSEEWEQAKFRVRQAAALDVTAVEHLLNTHLLCANAVVTNMMLHLPVDHVMHRFLTVHTFRTAYINQSALESLIPERSLFHRQSALQYRTGVVRLLGNGVTQSEVWKPYPDREIGTNLKTLMDAGKLPVRKFGIDYYRVVEQYVIDWVGRAYGDEAQLKNDETFRKFYVAVQETTQQQKYSLPVDFNQKNVVDMLTQFVFTVTGYHELVGSISEFLTSKEGYGLRARATGSLMDFQCHAIGSALIATTSTPTPPLMSDFRRFYGKGQNAKAWEVIVWGRFQDNLKRLAKDMEQENKNLPHPVNSYNPDFLECAVSV
eukprot:m.251498 g.251498  ORF g.251498 m.251498 type:complete len:1031 (-) comp16149_c0_seq9:132-3224(-)